MTILADDARVTSERGWVVDAKIGVAQDDSVESGVAELKGREHGLDPALMTQYEFDVLDADVPRTHDASHRGACLPSAEELGEVGQA